MTIRNTQVEQCLRCGKFDMVEGLIHDAYYQGRSPLRVWLGETPVPVKAFVCRFCGHTELMANFRSVREAMPGKARACPKCDAVYTYQRKHEVSEGVVRCQNCGVEFHLSVQIECPYCHAAYLYSMEKTTEGVTVPCQNCGKSFLLSEEMIQSNDDK